MLSRLLIWWVALLTVTRVNFLGESSSFVLTPFLLLSPIIVAIGFGNLIARGGSIRVPRRLDRFVLIVTLMLGVILLSAFLATDLETSARRTTLLFAQIILSTLGGLILANQSDPRRILVEGATLGLLVAILFNVVQLSNWLVGDWLPQAITVWVQVQPGNYAGVVPRLTGGSHDPNIGGIGILCYIFLVVVLGESTRSRRLLVWAGVFCVLLTLSRSAMLAAVTVLGVSMLIRQRSILPQQLVLSGAGVIGSMALLLLIVPSAIEPLNAAWEVVGTRFSMAEGSSREHAIILARGWEVATYDLKHLLFGVGYGNAYTTLQDIFPGNPYGNFHSLFMTLFAESGIIAAALYVILVIYPLIFGGLYRPIIAGLIVFNLFQQLQTDPIWWLLLLLAWTGVGTVAAGGSPVGIRPGARATTVDTSLGRLNA